MLSDVSEFLGDPLPLGGQFFNLFLQFGALGGESPNSFFVVGFDNDIATSSFDISSYDFGVSGIIRAATRYVLSPRAFDKKPASDTECEGLIFERSTTGKVE